MHSITQLIIVFYSRFSSSFPDGNYVVIWSLINSPAFIITKKFAYYSINYAATIRKSSSEDNLPAVAILTRL